MSETKRKLLGLFRSRSTAPPSSKGPNNVSIFSVQSHDVGGLMQSRTGSANIAKNDLWTRILLEAVADVHTAQGHRTRDLSLDVRLESLCLQAGVLLHHNP
jgi:formate-dependent nitrite reductase cytochrome c552 subunit